MTATKPSFTDRYFNGGTALPDDKPVPGRVRGFYGLGQSAEAIKNWAFGTLLLIYYVQVLGLSGSLAGLAIAIALGFDAISDPAVGSLSDNFKSRYGRRHPFMLGALLPLPLCFFALFWPPTGLTGFGLFLWLTFFTVLTRTALTFFNVPYQALGAELSRDYHERTVIVMFRMGTGYVAALLIVFIAFTFLFVSSEATPDPQLTRDPYFNFAIVCGGVMFLTTALSTWGTRGTIPALVAREKKRPPQPFRLGQIYKDLFQAFENPSFRALIIAVFLVFVYLGVHSALATHLKTFFWHLDTNGIRAWQMASIVGAIAGLPFAPRFNRIFEKKMTVIIGIVGATVFSTLPVLMKLIHLSPQNPDTLLIFLCACALIGSFASIQALISAGSMIADIADEHELTHGHRQEGIYFGALSFAAKSTSGLGNLIAGVVLDLITLSTFTDPLTVPADVLIHFGWVYTLIPIISIFSLWAFLPYHLDKKRHDEIIRQLEATHWRERLEQDFVTELVPHADHSSASTYKLAAEAHRTAPGRLKLKFHLTGNINALEINEGAPTRQDSLWQSTCFEAFISGVDPDAYIEINLAPSGAWALYTFKGYRAGQTSPEGVHAPNITSERTGHHLTLSAELDLTGLDLPETPWRMGLCAIVKEQSGATHYFALAHASEEPDFHHADCFVMELELATRP
ncbi:MAG: hypothetical protein EP340_03920 [Alphaproteobacteria bacterium]|nr:MAG: hypothetical protein EP340_03920 [Alphaproteobacteria bacterium]